MAIQLHQDPNHSAICIAIPEGLTATIVGERLQKEFEKSGQTAETLTYESLARVAASCGFDVVETPPEIASSAKQALHGDVKTIRTVRQTVTDSHKAKATEFTAVRQDGVLRGSFKRVGTSENVTPTRITWINLLHSLNTQDVNNLTDVLGQIDTNNLDTIMQVAALASSPSDEVSYADADAMMIWARNRMHGVVELLMVLRGLLQITVVDGEVRLTSDEDSKEIFTSTEDGDGEED